MTKRYNKILFSVLLLLLLFISACIERKETNALKGLSIQKVDELRFRRSYAAIQFRDIPEKELDSIENSNPECYAGSDTILLKKLQEFGLVDNGYGLIRKKFRYNGSKNFELTSGDKKISSWLVRPADSARYDQYNLVVVDGDKRSEIGIEGHYGMLNEDLKFLLLDIIPGGYKEVVILEEYYIMNGDNSDVHIYEIKK